jgi:hypothetical protein
MHSAGRDEPWAPFPRLPSSEAGGRAAGRLALRPFGLHEADLSVDFERTPRPALVTRILECCARRAGDEGAAGKPPAPDFFWGLTVGKRVECLLLVVAAAGRGRLSLTLRCPNEACGEELEVEPTVAELAGLQAESDDAARVTARLGDAALVLRKPTGADQLAWLGRVFEDENDAARAMLDSLVVDEGGGARRGSDALTDEWLDAAGGALGEHDPLVDFTLVAACPSCGEEHAHHFDLEEHALWLLRRSQSRLLASVHKLATHYHWSERQIFSVPHWRRAHYLSLIEGDG